MKWTREAMEALADKFAQVFVEAVEKSGGKAQIVKSDEGCPTQHEADAYPPCGICGGKNDIGEICAACAEKYPQTFSDDDNTPLAAGHGCGY